MYNIVYILSSKHYIKYKIIYMVISVMPGHNELTGHNDFKEMSKEMFVW